MRKRATYIARRLSCGESCEKWILNVQSALYLYHFCISTNTHNQKRYVIKLEQFVSRSKVT